MAQEFRPSEPLLQGIRELFEENPHGSHDHQAPFTLSTPRGWARSVELPWVHVALREIQLPDQGWKIHVSATEDTAQQTLLVVSRVAYDHKTPFKFLASMREFRQANSKYADRASGGKFLTLYPRDEGELHSLLECLEARLRGFPGPYILSDVRYGESPVFARYGAYRGLLDLDEEGQEILCVRTPDGTFVEDVRSPTFQVPEFVEIPVSLKHAVRERLHPTDSALDSLLDGFKFERPLHFSNGGGVYEVTRISDGTKFIMKEGRAFAGLDFRGVDAYDRLRAEYSTLQSLHHTGAVPRPELLRFSGDHAFLFEEFIEGEDLHQWVSSHFPFSSRYDVSEYEKEALSVLRKLRSALESIHKSGIAVMDIQPTNVIVTDGGEVRLIDLESACGLSATKAEAYIGTPGFVPHGPHTPLQRDEYGLLQIALGLFHPLTALSSLSDDVVEKTLRMVRRSFSLPTVTELTDLLEACHTVTLQGAVAGAPHIDPAAALGTEEVVDRVTAGIRVLRHLGDGSPSPYPSLGYAGSAIEHLNLERGLAGVISALGAEDPHAEADVGHLARQTLLLPLQRPGYLSGGLGISALLASRGLHDEAWEIYSREIANHVAPANISIRSGHAGRLVGYTQLFSHLQDPRLADSVESEISFLARLVEDPPPTLISPGRLASIPMGLMDGWSGVSWALSHAAKALNDENLFELAREAFQLDFPNLRKAPDGSLQSDDGFRMLPYVADGSAGMGMALSQIPRKFRRIGDTDVLEDIAVACRSRAAISSGLWHGRIGLVMALAEIDVTHVDGVPIQSVITEQLDLINPFLFTIANSSEIFVSDESNRRLGVDVRSGAAGVIFALRRIRQALLARSATALPSATGAR